MVDLSAHILFHLTANEYSHQYIIPPDSKVGWEFVR